MFLNKSISIVKKPKDKISEKASKEGKECPHALKVCVKEHAKIIATELNKTCFNNAKSIWNVLKLSTNQLNRNKDFS